MRRLIVIVLVGILIIPAVDADENLTVICTTTALKTLTEAVGKDKVDVISLVQPGVCPSHFDVRPSHVAEVGEASLVLYHGMELWLDDLIAASQNTDVEKVQVEGPWNTPDLAAAKIELLRDALSNVDPEHADYYKRNADTAVEELNTVADAIKNEADSLEVDTVTVVCMDWQTSFVEWIGFDVAATYAPPETLSIKDVNDVVTTGKAQHVVLVVDNLQSGTELGSEIAAQINAYHVVLTNYPGAVPGTDTIPEMLEYNANQLFDTLEKYREEKGKISELESQLREEKWKKQVFEALAAVLLVLCIVEAVVLYVRTR